MSVLACQLAGASRQHLGPQLVLQEAVAGNTGHSRQDGARDDVTDAEIAELLAAAAFVDIHSGFVQAGGQMSDEQAQRLEDVAIALQDRAYQLFGA